MSFLIDASRTALMVAAFRGLADERPERICSDRFAAQLAGADGRRYAQRFAAAFPHMELWVALRTRFFDDTIKRFRARGIPQVVMLGAGFDTRPARLQRTGMRFFEVDHPATQQEKLRRLAALRDYPIDGATYVPCDFEAQDFVDQLGAHGLDQGVPTLVIWEGVSPYLTRAAVEQTLKRAAAGLHARSVIAFDFFSRRLIEGQRVRETDRAVLEALRDLGEPVRFGTNDALALLFNAGFRHVRTLAFDEICLTYTGTWDFDRAFRFQRIALASRTVPDGAWI